MTSPKTHYSCKELAAMQLPDMPHSERSFRDLVVRENWEYIEAKTMGGKGGIKREYAPPAKLLAVIHQRLNIQQDGQRAAASLAVMNAVKQQVNDELSRKTQLSVAQIREAASVRGKEKFDAKFEILLAFRDFFAEGNSNGNKLLRKKSYVLFAEAYNQGEIKVSAETRATIATLSARTIERAVGDYEKEGFNALADARAIKGSLNGRTGTIESNRALEHAVIAVITEKPHIKHSHFLDILNKSSIRMTEVNGEKVALWPEISDRTLKRYLQRYIQNNQAYLAETNPDAYKNKYLSSMGTLAGDVVRLNQRWELDGTPADWMLQGGRYTASVCIDLFARRPKILFSKTPRTETNKLLLRSCMLDWGVPESVKTDNGTDYVSREMRMFLEEMGIEHQISPPYTPQAKGHVERFIQTYLHSILELLDSFIGHNVAERKVIESRESFAKRLETKGEVIELDMTVDELQTLTNAWVTGTYMQREHRTLKVTPAEKLASWRGPIKRIENVRAFDVLLAKPVTDRRPVITKKGIRYEHHDYCHAELVLHQGEAVDIRLDPNDIGRLVVYLNDKFLCIAECPELTGISRAEVAAEAAAMQNEAVKEGRKAFREARKALPSTGDVVKQMVLSRAEAAGKVTILETHVEKVETERLKEAAKAAEALENQAPPLSPYHAHMEREAKKMIAEADALLLKSQLKPEVRVFTGRTPLESMTPEQRYETWLKLDQAVQNGDELKEEWQKRHHAFFPKSSTFKALHALKKEQGAK